MYVPNPEVAGQEQRTLISAAQVGGLSFLSDVKRKSASPDVRFSRPPPQFLRKRFDRIFAMQLLIGNSGDVCPEGELAVGGREDEVDPFLAKCRLMLYGPDSRETVK